LFRQNTSERPSLLKSENGAEYESGAASNTRTSTTAPRAFALNLAVTLASPVPVTATRRRTELPAEVDATPSLLPHQCSHIIKWPRGCIAASTQKRIALTTQHL